MYMVVHCMRFEYAVCFFLAFCTLLACLCFYVCMWAMGISVFYILCLYCEDIKPGWLFVLRQLWLRMMRRLQNAVVDLELM